MKKAFKTVSSLVLVITAGCNTGPNRAERLKLLAEGGDARAYYQHGENLLQQISRRGTKKILREINKISHERTDEEKAQLKRAANEDEEKSAQDFEAAMKWLKKAADQGNPHAMMTLGLQYQFGARLPKDINKCIYWYTKAGETGYAYAYTQLAEIYGCDKQGVKDLTKAFEMRRKVYETDKKPSAEEIVILAELYIEGKGCEVNHKLAYALLLEAKKAYKNKKFEEKIAELLEVTKKELSEELIARITETPGYYSSKTLKEKPDQTEQKAPAIYPAVYDLNATCKFTGIADGTETNFYPNIHKWVDKNFLIFDINSGILLDIHNSGTKSDETGTKSFIYPLDDTNSLLNNRELQHSNYRILNGYLLENHSFTDAPDNNFKITGGFLSLLGDYSTSQKVENMQIDIRQSTGLFSTFLAGSRSTTVKSLPNEGVKPFEHSTNFLRVLFGAFITNYDSKTKKQNRKGEEEHTVFSKTSAFLKLLTTESATKKNSSSKVILKSSSDSALGGLLYSNSKASNAVGVRKNFSSEKKNYLTKYFYTHYDTFNNNAGYHKAGSGHELGAGWLWHQSQVSLGPVGGDKSKDLIRQYNKKILGKLLYTSTVTEAESKFDVNKSYHAILGAFGYKEDYCGKSLRLFWIPIKL